MNVVKNLACALGYLHKNDIVHRDLKLENILITKNPVDPDDQLYIKITDFGLSATRNGPGHDDMLHDFCGTITYMAPEMVTTKSYSQQCDVWSMGIIMYVLLTGTFPFFSKNELQLYKLITTADVDYSVLQCSNEGKHLLRKLLERNPAFRITAAEVSHHPWISGAPGQVSTDSSNVLDMMRLWKDEMSVNRVTTSTQTDESDKLPIIGEEGSNLDDISLSVTNASGTYSNKSRRRLSPRLPDYSWVPPKINTNLSNSQREALRKKSLKNRLLHFNK
ncbi:serine/threonine-protein kinase 33-like [Diachasmimorpha longicaudata]|uniref:serine/threonine-protein kinase 33-like n=1 Tax=Diachasmimorpha longicaudata TaxID=58733 RepID=UPI0030B8A25D